MQVAEPIPLVDAEDAIVVPLGDDVADVVVEGLDGRHEFQDVLLRAEARQVELHSHGAVHVDAVQADLFDLEKKQETMWEELLAAQGEDSKGMGCWGCSHSDNLLLPLSALSFRVLRVQEPTVPPVSCERRSTPQCLSCTSLGRNQVRLQGWAYRQHSHFGFFFLMSL